MYLIGLTGQTGAGKTTVSGMLRDAGIPVIDADTVTHAVLARGMPFLDAVRRVFGAHLLLPDGALDRKAVAALIFSDENARARYQAIIYPYITQMIRAQIRDFAAAGEEAVILDAPTLFESGIDSMCQCIVSVLAPEAARRARILSRDGLTPEQADARMRAQHSEEFFRAHSDIIIENHADTANLQHQANLAAAQLRQRAVSHRQTINLSKEEPIMAKKDENNEVKQLKEALLTQKKHAVQRLSEKKIAAADSFCEDYKTFLDHSKTEREACSYAVQQLEKNGFRAWKRGDAVKSGDKIYAVNRGKAVVAAVIGSEPLETGIRITASHIDSPRLDLKQAPLYEDAELALFKTHYYGGIKKYQWTVVPLALHGVIIKANGETVEVCIGEDEGDPVFCVTDLLPHLASDQTNRTLMQGIKGEELNILIGSRPFRSDEGSDLVKLRIMQILNEKYGIVEDDFMSAELEAVPAGKARDLGFDRSMIAAYGHDDRVCAYPALEALIATKKPVHTAVLMLADKEEIGSEGTTGLQSAFFRDFVQDLAAAFGTQAHTVFAASQCLSADVTAAFDPTYPDVADRRNCSYMNYGTSMMKYTGVRGKAGCSDASAEYLGWLRQTFDKADVLWQYGELGKVDATFGGTFAAYLANLNIDTIDIGVPVLSMHAPLEVVGKIDVYATYEAVLAFNQAD